MGWGMAARLSKRSGHVSLNQVGTLPRWLASSEMCCPHAPCAQAQLNMLLKPHSSAWKHAPA